MKKSACVLVCLLIVSLYSYGQSSSYVPLNNTYYHTVDRYEILNGKFSETFFTSVKQYTRKSVAEFIDTLAKDSASLKRISRVDRFNFTYLANDNWEFSSTAQNDTKRPIFKTFYKKKSDLFYVNTKDFDLHVNPVMYFSGGYEQNYGAVTQNTRGLEVRGMIDKKVGFYTFMTDNQALEPSYVKDYRTQFYVIPGEGFNKSFKTNGVDYISARGYINFNVTRHIVVQFGHDKNFIGNGYRSLILSDNSASYTFLKLNTKVWKLNYTNLFTEMNAGPKTGIDTILPKKYLAFHHLSLNVTKHLNIGVFEAVAFRGRSSDTTKRGQFEIAYMNPIIFYRSIEQQLGSGDNALIGADFKWNFLRHFSMYGQIVLDEFVLSQVKSGDGWWANKQALQGGLKYIDAFGLKNFDLQGEINYVRPYTYSHQNNYTNFSNYNQPIMHPLGANFAEFIGIARYQPLPRLNIAAKVFYTKLGVDTANSNWGGNILKDYRTHEQDYGNRVGQGVKTNLIYSSLNLSYMMLHNVFLDGYVIYRSYSNIVATPLQKNTLLAGFSIRWYIPQHLNEF